MKGKDGNIPKCMHAFSGKIGLGIDSNEYGWPAGSGPRVDGVREPSDATLRSSPLAASRPTSLYLSQVNKTNSDFGHSGVGRLRGRRPSLCSSPGFDEVIMIILPAHPASISKDTIFRLGQIIVLPPVSRLE